MLRTTLRGIRAHKLRFLVTTLSIVLGVGFIAGTYILTDTMKASFEEVFTSTTAGIDLAVRGETEFTAQFSETDRPPVSPEALERIREVDGVRVASGEVAGIAVLLDRDGEPIGGNGPPTLGVAAPIDSALANSTLRTGGFPMAVDEIAIDAATAEANDFVVGSEIQVVTTGPVETYTLVGTFGFGEVDNLAGASVTMFAPERAIDIYAPDGFDEIYIAFEDGADPETVEAAVVAAAGDGVEVLTGQELSASVVADINQALGFFTTALLVFAGVSLFVGSFLIANTFSIIVAQRTRELALLRAVGASRRQVLTGVLSEALLVGLLGSLLGLLLGLGVAVGLQAVLQAFGIDLPSGDTVLLARTVVVSFVVGVGITMLAAVVPAIRSTRVAPVMALQDVALPPKPLLGRWLPVLGGVVLALGVFLLARGLFSGAGIAAVGAGAAVTLLGAAALSSFITTPIIRMLGAPIAATRGVPGQLARENAIRSPRRTAATASALMIGLALISFVAILGASITRSAEVSIDEAFLADYLVSPENLSGPPGSQSFSSDTVSALQALDEVAVATALSFGEFGIDDGSDFLTAVDPNAVGQVLGVEFIEGGWDALEPGGIALNEGAAESLDAGVGDQIDVLFAASGATSLTVQAIFEPGSLDSPYAITQETYADSYADEGIAQVLLALEDGVALDVARPEIERVLEPFPTVQVQNLSEIKQSISDQIGQLLGLLSALLLLSIIVALFGIVNTLGLSVLERTRELGLLRAVGAMRRQVRTMVRLEAVLIAVLGALLGLIVGALFGWMVVSALADSGISQLVFPAGQLIVFVVLAAGAGVLAAILPARKAAKTDILRALEAS